MARSHSTAWKFGGSCHHRLATADWRTHAAASDRDDPPNLDRTHSTNLSRHQGDTRFNRRACNRSLWRNANRARLRSNAHRISTIHRRRSLDGSTRISRLVVVAWSGSCMGAFHSRRFCGAALVWRPASSARFVDTRRLGSLLDICDDVAHSNSNACIERNCFSDKSRWIRPHSGPPCRISRNARSTQRRSASQERDRR